MASSNVDWAEPLEFENGTTAYVIGEVSASGKLRDRARGTSDYAEVYAELYEQGIRYMVATDPMATEAGCVNAKGHPVSPYDNRFFAAALKVRNRVRAIVTDAMEEIEGWGMFA